MLHKDDINIRDPYILIENGIYYLYSSKKYPEDKYPSIVCYTSKDLIHFNEPIKIFTGFDGFWATIEYWAPEVHKYNGSYYLFLSLKAEDKCRGTQIFKSDAPDGKFIPLTDDAITPRDWECLDGTLHVENGIPYIVFCHEWLQTEDGEVCVAELSKDLTKMVSEPKLLFKGSTPKWSRAFRSKDFVTNERTFVTDGPFLFKHNDQLCMIWSSFCETGYALGLARSNSILGPWVHDEKPLFEQNGGHGMVFIDKGETFVTLHSPNTPNGAERMVIYNLNTLLK